MTDHDDASDLPSWHDNLIYGLHLQAADPDQGIWRSDLLLDIDHIVEWVCGAGNRPQFRVAPATLAFHDVTNLRISLDFSNATYRQNINELSIAQIRRPPINASEEGVLGSYFEWSIELNLPQGGEISFGASGYTQKFRAEPALVHEQRLSADDRPPVCRRWQTSDVLKKNGV